MTLVQNHRLPLSGNKALWLLALLWVSACSPKVNPVTKTPARKPAPVTTQPAVPPVTATPVRPLVTPASAKTSTVALLLPFSLDNLGSVRGYRAADLKKANIAIEYYQGFKLALDSLTSRGYNYKLQVFDTKDEPAYTHSLAGNPNVRGSQLIVGPVFPEGIKSFIGKPAALNKPLLSPLSPASPDEFGSTNLITINPPLEYHARSAALYVNNKLRPRKIFILRSGFSADNKYIDPFKKTIDTASKRKIQVINFTVSHGSITALLPQLNNKVENVFIVASVNQSFLSVTLRSLDTLSRHYPVTVIGHPNWEKATFLKADLLQRIKTHITSADRVNYRSAATINFIKAYRKTFASEPTAYAYKGFDEGMYFGEILGQDGNEMTRLNQHKFTALHNDFQFITKPGLGWVNTHVSVLKYVNFELRKVE
ncbi:hypothetical protein ABDD95_05795 [Mucilaginibacter sp. PAMB04274]|uniref:ABC transporter substrate-binding protein n=1 Tax=Mucilaginibacter sp. PAMB04274 TaxID=3138568 RepID=UPI0031F62DB2